MKYNCTFIWLLNNKRLEAFILYFDVSHYISTLEIIIDLVEQQIYKIYGEIKLSQIFQKDIIIDFSFDVEKILNLDEYKSTIIIGLMSSFWYLKLINENPYKTHLNSIKQENLVIETLKSIVLNHKVDDIKKLKELLKAYQDIKADRYAIILCDLIKQVEEKLHAKYWRIGYENSPTPEKYIDRGVTTCLLGFIHIIPILEPDIMDIDILTYERD